jgi:hypothetical protein
MRADLSPQAGRGEGRAMLLLMIISYQSKPPVIPGRAKREPGIHNHDREYGFPDVQLHI